MKIKLNEETSLAYEYHRFEQEKKPVIKTVAKGAKGKAVKRQTGLLRAAICMTVIVLTLSALIYTRVVQTELSAQYNQAVVDLNTLKGENARLQVKLEDELSADNIEKIARDQLNMQELDNSKVYYVDFNSQAKSEVLKKQTWLDNVLSWFRNITGQ